MIRQIETEINRFNDILYIIQMLKDQSFRENHWNVKETSQNFKRYFLCDFFRFIANFQFLRFFDFF